MYDTCMPTWYIVMIYSIVSQKMADLCQIYKNSAAKNQFAQITIHRNKKCWYQDGLSIRTGVSWNQNARWTVYGWTSTQLGVKSAPILALNFNFLVWLINNFFSWRFHELKRIAHVAPHYVPMCYSSQLMKPPGKKLLIIHTSTNFIFILIKKKFRPLLHHFLKRGQGLISMACLDSSWKTVPVEPISSKLMAAKRGENWGQRVKKQKSKTQLDESNWEKTSNNQFDDWHWEDWKVPSSVYLHFRRLVQL